MAGPPPSTPPRGPRVLEESDYGGAAASGASGQTGPLIGPVDAPRATGSALSSSPPRHRVLAISKDDCRRWQSEIHAGSSEADPLRAQCLSRPWAPPACVRRALQDAQPRAPLRGDSPASGGRPGPPGAPAIRTAPRGGRGERSGTDHATPAVPRTGATAAEVPRVPGVPGPAWPAAA